MMGHLDNVGLKLLAKIVAGLQHCVFGWCFNVASEKKRAVAKLKTKCY